MVGARSDNNKKVHHFFERYKITRESEKRRKKSDRCVSEQTNKRSDKKHDKKKARTPSRLCKARCWAGRDIVKGFPNMLLSRQSRLVVSGRRKGWITCSYCRLALRPHLRFKPNPPGIQLLMGLLLANFHEGLNAESRQDASNIVMSMSKSCLTKCEHC